MALGPPCWPQSLTRKLPRLKLVFYLGRFRVLVGIMAFLFIIVISNSTDVRLAGASIISILFL